MATRLGQLIRPLAQRSRQRRPLQQRPLRVALLGGAILTISTASHGAGAAALPSGQAMVAAALVALAITRVACHQRRSPLWLAAYLLGMQALLHVILTLLSSHHGGQGSASHTLMLPAPMLAAHALATIGAAAIVIHGNAVIDRWVGLLARTFVGIHLPVVAIDAAPDPTLGPAQLHLPAAWHVTLVQRRGPPLSPISA